MPTIGFGSYPQGAKFSFPRSFIKSVAFDGLFPPLITGGPDFEFAPTTAPGFRFFISFSPVFWAWSSNAYTLDFVIIASYYTQPPSPVQTAYNFRVKYRYDSPSDGAAIEFYPTTSDTPPVYYALPAAPSTYDRSFSAASSRRSSASSRVRLMSSRGS
jgi:hypothetical protein